LQGQEGASNAERVANHRKLSMSMSSAMPLIGPRRM
jgi:hypothetical protein